MNAKILLTSLLIGASLMANAAGTTTRETITVNGQQREMLVHLPNKLADGAPLVISCHGMNQDANYQCNTNSKWTAVSDTAGFVVVFPDGINKGWDLGGSKDVNFMCAIIDDMHARYNTSVNRVYLSGFSMGGMFTYFCANTIPDRIAAFVPVSGYPMYDKSVSASRPVALMHVHGTGDDVCVFSGVQPTLDNWIKHNKCNTTPEVIKPYPAGKTGSGATMTKWTGGTDGSVVYLLEFEGKGHWQSEDPSSCLTSIEAWNFMKQWSLGPEPPHVQAIEPEDNSFDLTTEGLDITMTFDSFVEADGVEATLSNGQKSIPLAIKAVDKTLTLTVPAIEAGEYRLTVKNVLGDKGGVLDQYKGTYTFGYEEVGETVPNYNEVFNADLGADESKVGEGIPYGWHRINSSADGSKDEKGSGSANTGGARMKYFMSGGDFAAGFYLSAREYEKCEITYGRYTPDYALHFEPGRYVATFNSAFWNEGSMSGDVRFDFEMRSMDGTPVATFASLPSASNLGEQPGRIEGSYAHTCEFDIDKAADYTATYRMTQGWAAVIVGNLKIVTAMSAAERYKGTFLRTLAQAKAVYAGIPANMQKKPAVILLSQAIAKYEGLVSTAPSVYEAAIAYLQSKIENAMGFSGIESIVADGGEVIAVEYFDVMGRAIAEPQSGMAICRVHYADGSIKVKKIKF